MDNVLDKSVTGMTVFIKILEAIFVITMIQIARQFKKGEGPLIDLIMGIGNG